LFQLFHSYLGVAHAFLWCVVRHSFVEINEVCLGHWTVSGPVLDAATFEAWGVVPWHAVWSGSLHVYCFDICRSSLCWGEAASSSILGVAGSSYVHWDRAVVLAARCI
jgi:hypothetical protein